MTATDWTIIIVAALACLTYLISCGIRLEAKRVEVEIQKARPRQTLVGEVERTPARSPAD
jgi:hypothetical protein